MAPAAAPPATGRDQQRRVERPVHAAQALQPVEQAAPPVPSAGPRRRGRSAPGARSRNGNHWLERICRRISSFTFQVWNAYSDAGREGGRRVARQLAREQVHAEAGEWPASARLTRLCASTRLPVSQRDRRRLAARARTGAPRRPACRGRVEGVAVEEVQRIARELVQHPRHRPHVEGRRAVRRRRGPAASRRERPGGDAPPAPGRRATPVPAGGAARGRRARGTVMRGGVDYS